MAKQYSIASHKDPGGLDMHSVTIMVHSEHQSGALQLRFFLCMSHCACHNNTQKGTKRMP